MIDEFIRFSNAVIIREKDDSMNMLWNIRSASLVSLSDNGGEFIGDDFYMCGKF